VMRARRGGRRPPRPRWAAFRGGSRSSHETLVLLLRLHPEDTGLGRRQAPRPAPHARPQGQRRIWLNSWEAGARSPRVELGRGGGLPPGTRILLGKYPGVPRGSGGGFEDDAVALRLKRMNGAAPCPGGLALLVVVRPERAIGRAVVKHV